jgi:hypothetical protein
MERTWHGGARLLLVLQRSGPEGQQARGLQFDRHVCKLELDGLRRRVTYEVTRASMCKPT